MISRFATLFLTSVFCLLTSSLRAADESPPEQIPQQVQSSVERGLQWLAAHQDPSTGAWPTNMGGTGAQAAITSLSAMAFMARGHVPGQGIYGENLNHAVDYVLSIQRPDGVLTSADVGGTMYDHGISTVMLCEAYGMLDDRRQELAGKAIGKAVRVILTAQAIPKSPDTQGGWRYQPTSGDSDISVTGWQLMALRGAANIGAAVPPRALQSGIAYVKRRAVRLGGFAYVGDVGPTPARTGTGILALELLGQHNTKEALAGGDWLLLNPPATRDGTYYFYTVYYCAQAAWQLGGNYWTAIDRPIRDSLLQRQALDGSWTVEGSGESGGGDAYGTAMSLLALTVPYRYLPIYQR